MLGVAGGTCRHKHHTYKAHCVETDHDSSGRAQLILRHRNHRSLNLHFDCILRDGLSFTAPIYAPLVAQRKLPLPKPHLIARLISIDADSSSNNPLLDTDALLTAPHGHDYNDLVQEPSTGCPIASPVTTAAGLLLVPHQPAAADRSALFVNHLNRDALRTLWHQQLGHIHGRRVSNMHKYAIGVPELPLLSSADQCPTCMAAKMRKNALQPSHLMPPRPLHRFWLRGASFAEYIPVHGKLGFQPRNLLCERKTKD